MEFHALKTHGDGSHAYLLCIPPYQILFAGGIPFSTFLYHSPAVDLEQPRNISSQVQFPFKIDLKHLSGIEIKKVSLVILSSYEDIYIIPYLLQHPHFQGKILLPQTILHLASYIYGDFSDQIEEANRFTPDYYQEQIFYDQLEQKNIDITNWVDHLQNFNSQELIGLVYNEIWSYENLKIMPISDGLGTGGIWKIQIQNKQIGVIMNAGFCPKYRQIETKYLDDCDLIIFGSRWANQQGQILEIQAEKKDELFNSLTLFDETILQIKQQGINGLMPVKDFSAWFNWISFHKQIQGLKWFLVGKQLDAFIQYGNADIDFLDDKFKDKIYRNNPENPMKKIENFIQQGYITHFNSIFDLIEFNKNKSFEQLIKQNQPCIYVILDSTMRFGEGERFIKLLENGGGKVVLLTDPGLQSSQIFSPFKDLSTATIKYCPLDFNFKWEQMKENFKNIRLKQVILHQGLKFFDYKTIYYQQGQFIFLKHAIQQENEIVSIKISDKDWIQFNELQLQYGQIQIKDKQIEFLPLNWEINYQGLQIIPNTSLLQKFQKILTQHFQQQYKNIQNKINDTNMIFYTQNKILLFIKFEQKRTKIYTQDSFQEIYHIYRKFFNFLS